MCLHVRLCVNETCTPLCVSECSPSALHLQAGEVKDGVGGKSEGPPDGRDLAANDPYRCEIYSPVQIQVLSLVSLHPQHPTTPFLWHNDIVCVCLSVLDFELFRLFSLPSSG